MDMSLSADSHRFLASPVLGSAIGAGFVDRVFAPSISASPKTNDVAIAEQAFDRLAKAGQSFRREGKAIPKDDQNVKEIAAAVAEFRKSRLPRWQGLGVL